MELTVRLNFYQNHTQIIWVFFRFLAFIYFSAFASMLVQVEGLIGSNGILPLSERLADIESFVPGLEKYWYMPTLFWLSASDFMLKWVCYLGILFSLLLFFNVLRIFCLIGCYVCYLSIVQAGQDFTWFQWDSLLLETGILAVFLNWGSSIIVFLFRWLIARFMFMGGVVKIVSGDVSWANFTALNYHYETQPLPTPLAFYLHHFPEWFHKACVGGVFFIELIVPFFVFLTRPFRLFACFSFVLLQSSIILTGNYTFFNLLTILLCLFLLEDKDISLLLPNDIKQAINDKKPVPGKIATTLASGWLIVVLLVCFLQFWVYQLKGASGAMARSLLQTTANFSLVNNYGPFAVMTRTRNEIIIQGSNDGKDWKEYEFNYKPGKLDQALGWNIPHQPRLDWQMWFAALQTPVRIEWFDQLLVKVKQGNPSVLALLKYNPFPGFPPKQLRAVWFTYQFSSLQHFKNSGEIWQRKKQGVIRQIPY